MGAGEVEDDLGLLAGGFFFGGDVGMKELVADVGENGGAAGRDAAFGHEDEEAEEVFAKVLGGGEVPAVGKEILREVGGVIGERRKDGSEPLAEMPDTKTGYGICVTKAAPCSILIAILAAGIGHYCAVYPGRRDLFRLCGGGFGAEDFDFSGLRGHGFLFLPEGYPPRALL